MRNATPPCLDSFCRLDRLGLSVPSQIIAEDHTVLICCPTTPANTCPGCGGRGARHDTVVRRLAHVPFGWKPTVLEVQVPRYRCLPCGRVWRHDLRVAAPTRGKLSRDAITLAVKHIVIDRLSIARIAAILGVAWNTCSDAILAAMQGPALDLIGKDTLKQLPALLERADLVMTPDSGPMHIANAMGTRVLGLHAASNPARSGPYTDRRYCVDRYDDAARRYLGKPAAELRWGTKIEFDGVMELVTVDDAVAAFERYRQATSR